MKKDKNGAVSYKKVKSASYNDYFTEWDGWMCNECGETIGCDDRDMSRHLMYEHDIELESWN